MAEKYKTLAKKFEDPYLDSKFEAFGQRFFVSILDYKSMVIRKNLKLSENNKICGLLL